MSLINQMLRDLQQRQGERSVKSTAAAPVRRPTWPRQRFRLGNLLRTIPPLVWVGAGGVAGVILILGLAGRVADWIGPDASLPVPPPPAEMVAIAKNPARAPSEVTLTAKRRTPPVPLEVPPPSPPLAYGESAPANVPSQPLSAPDAAVAVPVSAYPSNTPAPGPQPVPAAGWRQSAAPPAKSVPLPGVLAGREPAPPGRLHPDLLPGAVNATNLALRKAAGDIAIPPPAATPYGQAEAAYRQGRKAYEANRTELSLEALRRSLGFYPGHLPARELLADQYEMAGRTEEAFALLQQGLVIAPDYTPLRKRMARGLLDRGDTAGAIKVLIGSGLPRTEEDPELHRMLAGIYQQLGENFLAAQTYRNLLIGDPQNGTLWVGLGDVLAADGQPGEARKAYRRALAIGGLSRELAALVQQKLGKL